ncbi:MAG: acetyl-CoA decarbonylase/synthase complex subunit delta [Chloroflexi bacterium]|nr:acetyl-CoA decarbonylase/synthase complex subunit delta [Chloroflexota bacterium]
MSFPIYSGQINQVPLGCSFIGGSHSLPFYEKGYAPKFAYAITDALNKALPPALQEEWNIDLNDTVFWAKEALHRGADALCLHIVSIDPNGQNKEITQALNTIEKVLNAVSLPLILWGSGHAEKDKKLFTDAAAKFGDQLYAIGPVQQEHYKEAAAAVRGSNIKIIASTPVDVNMAKQLNIMLENEGVTKENILIDPVVSAIGYGLEYCYSVIERIRTAALIHNDAKLQNPLVCNIGLESWKVKEAYDVDEDKMGHDHMRGVMWEATSASLLASAGADLIIMLSPKAKELTQKMCNTISQSF